MTAIVGGPGGTTPIDPSATPATPAADSGAASSATVARRPTSSRPLVGVGVDTDLDGITDDMETKVGLDPLSPKTESSIGDREAWDIPGSGYAAYGDDAVTIAVHKYGRLFGRKEAMADAGNSYWESYRTGKATIPDGSWLPNEGSEIEESDFEMTTGVPIWGDPKIGDTAYKLLRAAAAPQDAVFAGLKANGHRIAARSTDSFVPTVVGTDGKLHEAKLLETSGYWAESQYQDPVSGDKISADDVVWRLKTKGGKIKGRSSDQAMARGELLGLEPGTRFDFIDGEGNNVPLDKAAGDRVAASWKDGGHWVALRPRFNRRGRVSGYTKYTYDPDGNVASRRRTSKRAGDKLVEDKGDEVLFRIQTKAGALKGDGKIQDNYDQSWWGRCQNVATIDQSNIPQPDRDLRVVSNHHPEKGEELATRFTDRKGTHVVLPRRDPDGKVTGYDHQIRGPRGGIHSTEALSLADGAKLAKKGEPVIVTKRGKLKDAEFESFTRKDATMLTALMSDGATEYKNGVGNRFWGYPDYVSIDGKTEGGKIVSIKTEGGDSKTIVRRRGNEWEDVNSALLRGQDFEADTRHAGRRAVAWTSTSMDGINARRTGDDKVASIVFERPDGRRETIDASRIGSIGRENLYDMLPTDLWKATGWIKDGKSFTAEKYTGEQVWNYGVRSLATERIDHPPARLAAKDKLPGALAGTTDPDGKVYFRTKLDTMGGEVKLTYWAKLDDDGKVTDFNWLEGHPPDFFWQSHVQDSFDKPWSGEGNVAGTKMDEIQKLYNASIGGYEAYAVGDVVSTAQLSAHKAVRP